MFGSEIKEVVYIAVSAILLSLVLGLVSYLITVRGDMATIRNREIQASQNMVKYREFNKYDGKTVHGVDVVEAIRTYYDTGIVIYVNTSGPNGLFDYYISREIAKDPENADMIDSDWLQSKFKVDSKYTAYLVYDGKDPKTVEEPMGDLVSSSDVTAIVFLYKG